jgi:hypothetical protein
MCKAYALGVYVRFASQICVLGLRIRFVYKVCA